MHSKESKEKLMKESKMDKIANDKQRKEARLWAKKYGSMKEKRKMEEKKGGRREGGYTGEKANEDSGGSF